MILLDLDGSSCRQSTLRPSMGIILFRITDNPWLQYHWSCSRIKAGFNILKPLQYQDLEKFTNSRGK